MKFCTCEFGAESGCGPLVLSEILEPGPLGPLWIPPVVGPRTPPGPPGSPGEPFQDVDVSEPNLDINDQSIDRCPVSISSRLFLSPVNNSPTVSYIRGAGDQSLRFFTGPRGIEQTVQLSPIEGKNRGLIRFVVGCGRRKLRRGFRLCADPAAPSLQ